ncbi:hypothetical protein CI109_101004 [Kwoniella shandongensis]|uniref:Uncharacterized protein n=1 Tax=Kwoniella shandongensis TaxID=1734106 RepID=A0AAJ8LDS3_9TREE
MRFTSPDSRPTLTPVGHRLLYLSEQKLSSLDDDLYDGGRALWKGVLVREAVRSAWKSVEDGSIVEMNDWSAMGAMGLDVIGEEDEEEIMEDDFAREDQKEARWFEDLMSSIGDEDASHIDERETCHEWVESDVSEPVYDFDYDVGGIQAFTFPSPTSPTSLPSVPVTISSLRDVSDVTTVDVDEVEVDDMYDGEDENEDEGQLDVTSTPRHRHGHQRHVSPITSFDDLSLRIQPPQPVITPRLRPSMSPTLAPPTPLSISVPRSVESSFAYVEDDLYYPDFDDYVDEFYLPPPLIRSLSSTSHCESDVCEDDECRTPPLSDIELDEECLLEDKDEEREQFYHSEIAYLYRAVLNP